MTGESCRKCKFFEQGAGGQPVGSCRRFPPVPIKSTLAGTDFVTFFPAVKYTNWCGEFANKRKVLN